MKDKTDKLFAKKVIINMDILTEAIETYYAQKYGTSYTFRDLELAGYVLKYCEKKINRKGNGLKCR